MNIDEIELYILFLFEIYFIAIIMMNLLIAILSDSYERQMELCELTNQKELLEYSMEIESIMFWKRKE